jgi:hypothetical protein
VLTGKPITSLSLRYLLGSKCIVMLFNESRCL